jgi:predicted nucleotidyltransferase
MAPTQTVPDAVLDQVVERLVEFYRPEKIYLFGSAARGEYGPDSDLDFLVVVPDDCPKEIRRSGAIYEVLGDLDLGVPVDVVPWRRSDFEGRAVAVVASLPATVVREGRLVYDAQTLPI